MGKLNEKYFEILNYKYEVSSGEWYIITFKSKSKIKHDKFYKTCRSIINKMGGKIYFVEGEGKYYGLDTDEGPAKYS